MGLAKLGETEINSLRYAVFVDLYSREHSLSVMVEVEDPDGRPHWASCYDAGIKRSAIRKVLLPSWIEKEIK